MIGLDMSLVAESIPEFISLGGLGVIIGFGISACLSIFGWTIWKIYTLFAKGV